MSFNKTSARPNSRPANKAPAKKYDLTITPLFTPRSGNDMLLNGLIITPEVFDAIQQVEIGGMLKVKYLKEESRTKDTSPVAYLEYTSKDEIEAFNNNRGNNSL